MKAIHVEMSLNSYQMNPFIYKLKGEGKKKQDRPKLSSLAFSDPWSPLYNFVWV